MIEMFLKWISYIFGFVGCGGLGFSSSAIQNSIGFPQTFYLIQ